MTVSFLVVDMEIRREIDEGTLSKLDQAVLPVIAAAGGIIVPALIYLSLNADLVRGRGCARISCTRVAGLIRPSGRLSWRC
jgi:Na+:H+ antiporter, NhaA family